MDEQDYVEGLNGEEIINDVLDQVEAKLRSDCNLRETDAYDGGYDGWVEIHLNLRGLDTAEIKSKIIVGAPASAKAGAETDADAEQKIVDARVDIPLEPRLNLVRERSGQGVPTLTKDETGKPMVKKRHYVRKQSVIAED